MTGMLAITGIYSGEVAESDRAVDEEDGGAGTLVGHRNRALQKLRAIHRSRLVTEQYTRMPVTLLTGKNRVRGRNSMSAGAEPVVDKDEELEEAAVAVDKTNSPWRRTRARMS